MATSPQSQPQAAPDMTFTVQPMQIANEIRVVIQVQDLAGMTFVLLLTQQNARTLSKLIKEGVEKAEVTLVKPQSALATA